MKKLIVALLLVIVHAASVRGQDYLIAARQRLAELGKKEPRLFGDKSKSNLEVRDLVARIRVLVDNARIDSSFKKSIVDVDNLEYVFKSGREKKDMSTKLHIFMEIAETKVLLSNFSFPSFGEDQLFFFDKDDLDFELIEGRIAYASFMDGRQIKIMNYSPETIAAGVGVNWGVVPEDPTAPASFRRRTTTKVFLLTEDEIKSQISKEFPKGLLYSMREHPSPRTWRSADVSHLDAYLADVPKDVGQSHVELNWSNHCVSYGVDNTPIGTLL